MAAKIAEIQKAIKAERLNRYRQLAKKVRKPLWEIAEEGGVEEDRSLRALLNPKKPFEPTPLANAVYDALKGKALRTDELADVVDCSRSSLFDWRILGSEKEPGELRHHGLVALERKLGFYRPNAPPPELCSG